MSARSGDFIRRLRMADRASARILTEDKLIEAFATLDRVPTVARVLTAIGATAFAVTHYTFDEPFVDGPTAQVQFTYHLTDRGAALGDPCRDEVRGSGIAVIDSAGTVRFEDVDAERYRIIDDEQERLVDD